MSGSGAGGNQPPFEIGLALAGAISAGAYVAGVLDFLFQALEEWGRSQAASPSRPARISIMAGASGGGIAGTVAALSASAGVKLPQTGTPAKADFKALAHLHDIWVTQPKLFDEGIGISLLSTEDLEPGGSIVSLLNGSLLDKIRDMALQVNSEKTFRPKYLAQDLHVVLTLTNLRGVPYSVSFKSPAGNPQHYVMVDHADRQHFILTDLGGGGAAPANLVGAYAPTTVSCAVLPAGRPTEDSWKQLGAAVLGTGAFPIGLPARLIEKPEPEIRYPAEIRPALDPPHTITPHWECAGFASPQTGSYQFWASDGGVIDNEPFGIVDTALEDSVGKANFATILIDPFIEPPDLSSFDAEKGGLAAKVAGQLINALIDQARFRPGQVFKAETKRRYAPHVPDNRFLINPSRGDKHHVPGSHLASGGLGGFAGFLAVTLRQHDFELGRRNCQRFLETQFAHPTLGPDGKPIPIIPLHGSARDPLPRPEWPRVPIETIDTFRDQLEGRANALVRAMNETSSTKLYMRLLVRIAWRFMRGNLLDMARDLVIIDLVRRDQIAELKELDKDPETAEEQRRVLCALIDPAWDFRTAKGISEDEKIDPTVALEHLIALTRRPDRFGVVEGPQEKGVRTFRIRYRNPSWLSEVLLLGDWIAKRTVN